MRHAIGHLGERGWKTCFFSQQFNPKMNSNKGLLITKASCTLLCICLSPYLKMKNIGCSHFSILKQIRYENDEVFTLPQANMVLIMPLRDKYFNSKNTIVFNVSILVFTLNMEGIQYSLYSKECLYVCVLEQVCI